MSDAATDPVTAIAGTFRDYATHFSPRDWQYSRDLDGITAVRRVDPADRLTARLRRALRSITGRSGVSGLDGFPSRWRMARHVLGRDTHLPDGVLDEGCILTYWEETGEYLQFVQPTVGALVAEWMLACPTDPHARAVAAEMQRIQDDYRDRIARGGFDA